MHHDPAYGLLDARSDLEQTESQAAHLGALELSLAKLVDGREKAPEYGCEALMDRD